MQIGYIGYPNTTGVEAIDYRITDPLADPDGFDDHYCETLIRLPRCFLAYAAPRHAPEIGPPPVQRNGHVTFGSFNNLAKVNRAVIALWAEILHRVEDACLVLKSAGTGDPETKSGSRPRSRPMASLKGGSGSCRPSPRPATIWGSTTRSTSRSIRFPTTAPPPPARRSGWACR